ncbi:aspartic proteinase CDR1-like [Sesamum indicum]|uniref:Aspartic proteinase CDR1-like n=1 Tax=Sesamum indicum TaxID=4182 RepID=A0A8M8USH2_SESIN|nr:aspartic proteinase CDR1-like [Sesamum indicum]
MAQTTATVICIFSMNLLLISSLPCVSSMSSSFRLKLIHRDSPLSPLYQPNLSDFQRFKRNVEISEARASYFQRWSEIYSEGNSMKPQNISLRLPLKFTEPIYTVELGLGTPFVQRTLVFDTGSGITWTQCKPCFQCFKQKEPLFDTRKSSSYKLMPVKNKLAMTFTCTVFGCAYYVGYTAAHVPYRVPGLVFGCGTFNKGPFGAKNAVSGILGMDKQPVSFARQLGGLIREQFSYCLTEKVSASYVKFGVEAKIRGRNAQSTPFLKHNQYAVHYGLNLVDISIGGQKLGLTQGTFSGGCVIDSGGSISLLETNAYSAVQDSLERYFSKFKNVRRLLGDGAPSGFLCYTQPKGFKRFPNLTFHFLGADFRVPSENLFLFRRNFFCLAMMASKNLTLLGAYQQRNVRIVYDLKDEMLSFAPEDCSRDAAA